MKYLLFATLALALAGSACRKNQAPLLPLVNGPAMVQRGDSVRLWAYAYDPDADSVSYLFDWRDGSDSHWTDPMEHGFECGRAHVYADTGVYFARVKARDGEFETGWSDSFPVNVGEYGPFVPHRPAGREMVEVGDRAAYVTASGHPLRRHVGFQYDWGDTLGDWGEFVESGENYSAAHVFTRVGLVLVRARARDELGHVTDWSEPESVTVYEEPR